ncbi:hypothetical protein OS493_040573, partial [Desmophyllum pertusum]
LVEEWSFFVLITELVGCSAPKASWELPCGIAGRCLSWLWREWLILSETGECLCIV